MVTRSYQSTEAQTSADERWTWSDGAQYTAVATTEEAAALARAALAFAMRCHGHQRSSDGVPVIEHPLEVARLLRDAGCSGAAVAAGLLHNVRANADISYYELRARFGAEVADLVRAVNDDDACIGSYRERKQVLRDQVLAAGGEAALLFAADKISDVRRLPAQIERDRSRFDATTRASRAHNRLEHYHEMRLEHFHESLRMLQRVAARHPLVRQLADDLAACPVRRHGAHGGHLN